eukprot:Gb_31340 [translate_table: standard]
MHKMMVLFKSYPRSLCPGPYSGSFTHFLSCIRLWVDLVDCILHCLHRGVFRSSLLMHKRMKSLVPTYHLCKILNLTLVASVQDMVASFHLLNLYCASYINFSSPKLNNWKFPGSLYLAVPFVYRGCFYALRVLFVLILSCVTIEPYFFCLEDVKNWGAAKRKEEKEKTENLQKQLDAYSFATKKRGRKVVPSQSLYPSMVADFCWQFGLLKEFVDRSLLIPCYFSIHVPSLVTSFLNFLSSCNYENLRFYCSFRVFFGDCVDSRSELFAVFWAPFAGFSELFTDYWVSFVVTCGLFASSVGCLLKEYTLFANLSSRSLKDATAVC